MISSHCLTDNLAVIGRGEAEEFERDLFDAQTRSAIRYADPAAWVVATAVARAVAPIRDDVRATHESIGLIVVSEQGPTETMDAIAEAARANTSSPLRYPAANPGSLAGVTCIAFALRGPTLNLIMRPSQGIPVALITASGWLGRRAAAHLTVVSHSRDASNRHRAHCLALSGPDCSLASAVPMQEADGIWLSAHPNEDCLPI